MTDSITFQLFRKNARKRTRPYKTITAEAYNGKLPLKNFLVQNKLESVSLWEGNDVIQLYYDDNGMSFHQFDYTQTYDLKSTPMNSYDREETFSMVDVNKVYDDFRLLEDVKSWQIPYVEQELPSELCKVLCLMNKKSTLRAEASRRAIIEMYLLFAIEKAEESQEFLVLDEELKVNIIREVERVGGPPEQVSYSGPLDFVVGHSARGNQIPKDTALIVIEAKKADSLDKGFAQTLAQASTILCLRRFKNRGLGDYKTYWIYSDGEVWYMGYVRPDKDNIMFSKTSVTAHIRMNFEENECTKVFSMLVAIIKEAYKSTLSSSSISIFDDQNVEAGNVDLDADVNTVAGALEGTLYISEQNSSL